MFLFSAIEADDCFSAYDWHVAFAAADDALFPRPRDEFESMVMDGKVWAAKSPNGDYLALAYANYDHVQKICEVGGLMVDPEEQSKGLGSTIMRLTLGHALLEENLLSISGVRIIAHVVEGNERPLKIIENVLKFHHVGPVRYPAAQLPGLRSRDGFVHGDEYELTFPDTIVALADWAGSWNGHVNGGTAHVEFRRGIEIADWAAALRAIVDNPTAGALPEGKQP
jgi:GNAT superfamily N-acetyltransferase